MRLAFSERRSMWGKKLTTREADKKFFPKKGKCYYSVSGEGSSRTGHFDHIVVGLLSRKRGIGSALLREAVERMRKEGAKRVVLELQSLQQEAMKKMIEKEGFKFAGYRREPVFFGNDINGLVSNFVKIPIYEKILK
ncbi:GNAT family N-acetyltransferase [Candidatus Micrarchaeota archaeon]|nr:GNAT family N-acetyltransferase [Candidatus Micrarchaeota archaeon]